jgi:small subunit ribosomal protein S8
MHSDPIADLLTRIRNANNAHKVQLSVPYSRIKHQLLEIFKTKGFIEDFNVQESKFKEITINLNEGNKKISLTRISKPGQRIYIKSTEIKPVRNGLGVSIVSTSQGLMTGDDAFKQKLGGELICEIY